MAEDHGPSEASPGNGAGLELKTQFFELLTGDCDLNSCLKLIYQGVDVNSRDEDGNTPLLWATLAGAFDLVKSLIKRHANVKQANQEGETPLHWAAMTGHLEIAELLLDAGAEVNALDDCEVSPLRTAVLNDDDEMVALLKARGGK